MNGLVGARGSPGDFAGTGGVTRPLPPAGAGDCVSSHSLPQLGSRYHRRRRLGRRLRADMISRPAGSATPRGHARSRLVSSLCRRLTAPSREREPSTPSRRPACAEDGDRAHSSTRTAGPSRPRDKPFYPISHLTGHRSESLDLIHRPRFLLERSSRGPEGLLRMEIVQRLTARGNALMAETEDDAHARRLEGGAWWAPVREPAAGHYKIYRRADPIPRESVYMDPARDRRGRPPGQLCRSLKNSTYNY